MGKTRDNNRLPPSSNTGVTTPPYPPFDVVDVDYLTLTTFDGVLANLLYELLYTYGVKPLKPVKLMQYDATRDHPGAFTVGRGYQKHKNGEFVLHSIGKIAGSLANTIYKEVQYYEYTCTRIDLQLTLYTSDIDYLLLYNELKNYVNCTLIQSSTNTLYIGSRKSDRFIRIYQHRFADELLYDRFEVEYKGTRAQRVYDNPDMFDGFLLAEIHRLNRYTQDGLLDRFVQGLAGVTPMEAKTARKDKSKGIDFYLKVVAPYLRSVIENPDFRSVIRYDLEQLDLF